MIDSPLIVVLRDAALARQVSRWLDDEALAHQLRCPGEALAPAGTESGCLTDVATLRDGTDWLKEPCVAAAASPTGLIVLGEAASWADHALAARHGATRFLGMPLSRDGLLAAVRSLTRRHDVQPFDVLLFGPADSPTRNATEVLTGAGFGVHVESNPLQLFERLRLLHPGVLLLLPGVTEAPMPLVQRMLRSNSVWDDIKLLCVAPSAKAAEGLAFGTNVVIGSASVDALVHAVSELARHRAPVSLSPLRPLLAMQDEERRALDTHALVSIADSQGNIVYANDNFCATSGYRRDELLGRNHRIVKSGVHVPRVYADLWRTIASGAIWQGELCNRRKDGSPYWVATTIVPTGQIEGAARRYFSIRTDITKAKQVQFALRQRVRQQRALTAVSQRLMNCDRAQLLRMAPDILRVGGRLLGASRVCWAYSSTSPELQVIADWSGFSQGAAASPAIQPPTLVTATGPDSGSSGQLSWWRQPSGPGWQTDDETFAFGLARTLGSAWSRTAAELSQLASQTTLTDMLKAFPGIVAAADENMVYRFANGAFSQLFGLQPDQVIGMRHEDLVGPEQVIDIRRRRERLLGAGQPITFDHSLQVPGEDKVRHFSIVHFTTGGHGGIPRRYFQIGIDITERRRMDDFLQQLIAQTQFEAKLQGLLLTLATELSAASSQSLDQTINAVLREVGEFFEVDRADLFRFSPDGDTVSNTHEWCAPGIPSKMHLLQAFPAASTPWYRHRIVDERMPVHIPDIDALPEEASAEKAMLNQLGLRSALSVPMQAGGRVVGFIGFDAVRRCITWSEAAIHGLGILGQVVANAQQRAMTEQTLIELRELAEAGSAAKSDFLASMSHELRTPMNAVLGFGQLLELVHEPPSREHNYVQEILKGGRHLLTLIDDVLDLARIESGRVDLSRERVALAEVVADCIRLMRPLADKRQILIAPDVGGYVVFADRVRLKQVLVNLLSNAIKYNADGGRIEITAAPVEQERVRVAVRDTGPGIAVERQAELFQPFNRLGAEAGTVEGTGIGLVLVRRLVTLMDGKVGVTSLPGEGSTFWFELPRPTLDDHDQPSNVADSTFVDFQEVVGKRVLYIDDNPPNLRLMESILARWPGVTLLTAQHPHLGLELAQAHHPALVLLDIQMSPLDGYQVLRHLRQQPDLAHIPVVALTANAMRRDVERALAAGFDDCLTKPFKLRDLLAVMERHLRSTAPSDQVRQR